MYNPKSLKAEEFISDKEILETLEYAKANKNNIELIDSILDKARPVKTENGYVMVKKNSASGLSAYDHIALDATAVVEDAVIY